MWCYLATVQRERGGGGTRDDFDQFRPELPGFTTAGQLGGQGVHRPCSVGSDAAGDHQASASHGSLGKKRRKLGKPAACMTWHAREKEWSSSRRVREVRVGGYTPRVMDEIVRCSRLLSSSPRSQHRL